MATMMDAVFAVLPFEPPRLQLQVHRPRVRDRMR